jgi:hypothetical protein
MEFSGAPCLYYLDLPLHCHLHYFTLYIPHFMDTFPSHQCISFGETHYYSAQRYNLTITLRVFSRKSYNEEHENPGYRNHQQCTEHHPGCPGTLTTVVSETYTFFRHAVVVLF